MGKGLLVTGGTGFIGRHLVDKLNSEHGTEQVYVLTTQEKLDGSINGKVKYITNLADVKHPLESIFHLATVFYTDKQLEEDHSKFGEMNRCNLQLTEEIINLAKCQKNPCPIIYTHTYTAFDNNGKVQPRNYYSEFKQFGYEMLALASKEGVQSTSVVLGDTFGGGDTRHKLPYWIKKALQEHQPVFTFQSPANKLVNYTHCDDVVDTLLNLYKGVSTGTGTGTVAGADIITGAGTGAGVSTGAGTSTPAEAEVEQSNPPGERQMESLVYFLPPENEITLGELGDLAFTGSNTAAQYQLDFGETKDNVMHQVGTTTFHQVNKPVRTWFKKELA